MRAGVLAPFAVGIAFAVFAACAQGTDETELASEDARPAGDGSFDVQDDAAEDDSGYGETRPLFDAVDDAPCPTGATGACTTTCKTPGVAKCVSGAWGACEPLPGDPCAGLDCTGKGDGLEHTFYADADGDGHGDPKKPMQACEQPTGYVTSSDDCDDGKNAVHPGATEVCNGYDDDCDGKVDDLPKVVTYELAYSAVPPCTTSDMASCKRGAYDWCRAKSACFTGGFGPVELGTTSGWFVCVGDGTLTGGWSDVYAAQPGCSSDALASHRVCESAVHRAGRAKGYASAILQTHAPSNWQFLGLPSSRAQPFDGLVWSDLTSQHAGCKPGAEDSWDCNAASHRFCMSKGFVSGYGPVEYNTVNVSVVCVK